MTLIVGLTERPLCSPRLGRLAVQIGVAVDDVAVSVVSAERPRWTGWASCRARPCVITVTPT